MDRRTFLSTMAVAAAGTMLPERLRASVSAPRVLSEFDYSAVRLLESRALAQREQTRAVLAGLDSDRVLRPFRVRGGFAAPGEELGSWYSTYGFAPAHAFGQWISALSRYQASTGDPTVRDTITSWVRGYIATVTQDGRFYRDNRFPSYTFDKLVCGLLEAHTLAHCPEAWPALEKTRVSAEPYLPEQAVARRETPVLHGEDFTEHCWDESYTLPENLLRAYEASGNRHYRDLAVRFLFDKPYFEPLARGENVLPGLHAYSHVNALCSAAKAHLVLDSPLHLQAAQNGMRFVEEQSFATGGWGPDEHFVAPGSGKLGESLKREHHSFETPCGSYAHFKLARYLLRITRDPGYGDSMEQVLYNCALGTLPLQATGRAFYYSDYTAGASKGFHDDLWPCCSGTLPQLANDYGISSYLRDGDDVYVNLYLPSELSWKANGAEFSLTQFTDYPLASMVELRLRASQPRDFAVNLRIPGWVNGGGVIRVNSQTPQQFAPGSFARLQRRWADGDRITLELAMSNYLVAVDAAHPDLVALRHGPLVLFAQGTAVHPFSRAELLCARQISSTEWSCADDHGQAVRFQPWMEIASRAPYTTYLPIRP